MKNIISKNTLYELMKLFKTNITNNHNHDNRYYTESEVLSLLNRQKEEIENLRNELTTKINNTINSVTSLEKSVGKIIFGTYCCDPKGNDYVDISVKSADIYDSKIIISNGDSGVWAGYTRGVVLYYENVRCLLSEQRTGLIRINYIYFHK